jgi:streptogramin lyase
VGAVLASSPTIATAACWGGGDAASSFQEAGSAGGATGESTGGQERFDVGVSPDLPASCGCGEAVASYIWVANSHESTISKIDTREVTETARYRTRGDDDASPSRTSVSLSGRMAAVANRHGGVAAFWTSPELCDPQKNALPGLQTSKGKDDVLAFGGDDCLAWYAPFEYTTQRPIGWAPAAQDPVTCAYADETLWTAGCDTLGDQQVYVTRLAGLTGEVLDQAPVDGMMCDDSPVEHGAYGGAVDAAGNFWTHHAGYQILARIDAVSLETASWPTPYHGYGITVDHRGYVWLSVEDASPGEPAAMRFDPASGTWALADTYHAHSQSGLQEDALGRIWMNYWYWEGGDAHGDGLLYIDSETLEMFGPFELGNFLGNNGISVDADGRIWSVAKDTHQALRFDPETAAVVSYDGLDYPYTYSDMTGWALRNAACPPEG